MINAVKNLTATLLTVLQTRLSLLGNELQVQKIMLFQWLGFFVALVFCLGLAVLLAVALMVSLWWEQRVLLLGILATVFFLVSALCFARLRRLLNTSEAMFGASLSALQDDVAQLRAAAGKSQRGQAGE